MSSVFFFLFLIHDPGKTLVSTASRPAYMVIAGKQASEQASKSPAPPPSRLILVSLGHTPSPGCLGDLGWSFLGGNPSE